MSSQRRRQIIASALLFLYFAAKSSTLMGQGGTEQVITGTITDQAGAVVPGAKVSVLSIATGIKTEEVSNSEGLYRTPPLKPGEYQIEISKEGFQTSVRKRIMLHLAEILRLDFQLQVGELSQTVEITGAAPILNTEDARISEVIEQKAVESLPLLDRRAGGLIALGPGVYYEGQDPQSFYAPRYSIGGSSNAILTVDGAPAGSDRTDVSQMTLNPPLESLQEVQVQIGYYGAEYGGAEGGMIRMTTKSGTNQFHGSAYEYFRNEIFDSRAFFSANKQVDRYHLFGGSIGGPIKKDRAFFFATAEGTKQNLPNSGTFTLPTVAMRNGDFSALGTTIYDPKTTRPDPQNPGNFIRDPFPGNVIPSDRFDPVAKNVLAFLPDVTTPGDNNYAGTWKNQIDRHAWTVKFDFQATPKDQLSYTWMYDRTTLGITGLQGWKNPAAIPEFAEDSFPYQLQSHIISHTHTFSPTLLNSFRFSFRPRWWEHNPPALSDPNAKWAEQLGVKNISRDIAFPTFRFSGYLGVAPGFEAYSQNPISQTEWAETLTYIRGKHTLKFGMDASRSVHALDGALNPTGSFGFDSRLTAQPEIAGTGDSIASFLLGAVSSASLSDNGIMKFHEWYLAPYVTDSIRVTSRLTLNLGLRWDLDLPIYEDVGGKISGFDLNRINPVSGTPGVLTFHGITPGTPQGLYYTDKNRFQPRFGFAYQIDNKTVLRGGYGIYTISPAYFQLFPPLLTGFSPADGVNFSSVDNGLTPAFRLQDGFPPWPRGGDPSTLNDGFGAVPVGQTPTTSVRFIQPNWPMGYTQAINLSVQRELPGQILFEADAIGDLGRKLPLSGGFSAHDFNQLPSSLWGVPGDRQTLRPFPQFASVQDVKAPEGIIDHWAMNLKLTKRLSNGLLFLTSFTLQKTIGVMDFEANENHRLSRSSTVFFNESNGPSGSPFRLFRFTASYDLPWGLGKRYLNSGALAHVFGGWNVGGIWTWTGGFPFSLSSPNDSLNCYCGAGFRLDPVGNLKLDNPTISRWFNTDAVTPAAFGTVGTLGRGVLVGPDFRNIDLSVSKTTNFKERYAIKFSWEMFNMTNTTKFGLPDSLFGDPGFGVIGGYRGIGNNGGFSIAPWYGARIMEFGLRFSF